MSARQPPLPRRAPAHASRMHGAPARLARGLLAAALLAGLAPGTPAQTLGLGRLFSSPEERIALDAQRGASRAAAADPNLAQAAQAGMAAGAAASPPAPPPEPVQLNGVVRRSSGKSTIWLNQVPHADGNQQLRADQSVTLRLASGRELVLKPGQSFNPADGTVQEASGR
jgi:hypothetical protein